MRDLVFSPLVPLPVILALALVMSAGLLVAAWRDSALSPTARALLFALRAASIAALLALLLRPMRLVPAPADAGKAQFTLAVDVSASMNTEDVDDAARWRAARDALVREEGRALWQLARDFRLNLRAFSDQAPFATIADLRQTELAEGARTDIAGLLMGIAHEASLGAHAGACLITDGRDNAAGDVTGALGLLRARRVPVWTVPLGEEHHSRDVHLRARFNQNFLFVNQPARLQATLTQSGYDGYHVNVHLYREETYVETRQAVLRQGLVQLDFPIREERKGLVQYSIRTDPLPGEADARNNERVLFARVVDQKSKVLLVEARPHWDGKFLLRTLQEDPNLEVTSIFYLTPGKVFAMREQTSGESLQKETSILPLQLPRTREELYAYDCILLGRDMDTLLTAAELKMLRDYAADRGGGLVFFRGPAFHNRSALGDLEPVEWTDEVLRNIPLELTEEGRASPIFAFDAPQPADLLVRTLPGMTSFTRVRSEKSLAVVLATGATPGEERRMAALAYQRYGKGKVMSISAGGLWRWAFLPGATAAEHGNVYKHLWAQIIRWLVYDSEFLPGQEITFHCDRTAFQPGERVRLAIRTRELPLDAYLPRIVVQPPEGPPETLIPTRAEASGDFTALFTPQVEGIYRAVLHNNIGAPATEEVRFTAYADAVETRMVSSDAGLLAHIARETGGEVLALDELDSLPRRVKAFAAQASDAPKLLDAWDHGLVLGLLLAMLSLEWLVRRSRGAL